MNKIFFKLLKPKAFKRAKNIKAIGREKRSRIINAIIYINAWQDIPVSQLLAPICETLKIEPSESARNIIHELILPNPNIEAIKKRLP